MYQRILIDVHSAVLRCPPCRMIGPIFEGLSKKEEFSGVEFCKVDVDEAQVGNYSPH